MKTIDLQSFFVSINYKPEIDREDISHICGLTKTRVDQQKEHFEFDYGMEQTFFIKGFIQYCKAESFFEIGTGRGTASYAISLIENIKKITTVDIISHNQKKYEAINHKPALVSNADLFDMIKFKQKEKISFKHVDDYAEIIDENKGFFDVCFIDGNHDNKSIILNDFNICIKLLKKPGYIIWDDYDPNQFKVKEVVDEISREHNLECQLIEFRGHMFGKKPPEKNAGEVIMKINENLR